MSKTTRPEDRLKKAILGPPPRSSRGAQTLMTGQARLWRWSGLALGFLAALVIAAVTLTPIPPSVGADGLDKLFHVLAFTLLIFPLILTDSRRWIWAVPLSILYGGAIELIQPSVGRTAEWLDFGANVTGVLAGAALAEVLHDRIRDRFFALQPSADPEAEAEAEAAARKDEAMRAELVDEMRVVLREELSSLHGEGAETQPDSHAEPPVEPPSDPASDPPVEPRRPVRR